MAEASESSVFNRSIRYFRNILDITMASMAEMISVHLEGKPLSVQQIQSYEASSEPKQIALIAIRDFFREKDRSISCDMLLERDFESEGYKFPDHPDDNLGSDNQELSRLREQIRDLRVSNSHLRSNIESESQAHLNVSESLNLITKQLIQKL